VVYTYDGVTWSTPRTIYHQWDDGHIPKVIANQMLVHPVTGFWILPYWNERPRQVRSMQSHAQADMRSTRGEWREAL
jgi:hypothetical protein